MIKNYRRDIDGLRAIAVLAVIFYHAGFPGFKGGYLGVDIFFVISGYLISSIIMNGLRKDNFSFLHFYERRARRIFPALIAVIIFCIPFSWVLLTPNDFKDFSQSIAFVTASISNILFWMESGYFDTSTELKPLIHTWSLAIEEQFYLLFPIFLCVMWKFFYRHLSMFLISAILISLILAEISSKIDQSSSFYLIHTRAWELLIGVFVAHLRILRPINTKLNFDFIQFVGILLIFGPIILYDDQTRHPGLMTVIPVLGAGLLLRYGSAGHLINNFLGNQILVSLGLISYSLYLLHHPIFTFMRHYSLDTPTSLDYVLATLLSVFLAIGFYKYIETPFRKKNIIGGKIFFGLIISLSCFLIFFSVNGHLSKGYPDRFGSQFTHIFDVQGGIMPTIDGNQCHGTFPKSLCIIGDSGVVTPEWALVGDSHAGSLGFAVDKMLKEIGASAIQLTQGGCSYAIGLRKKGTDCLELNKKIRSKILSREIKNIIIAGRYVRNLELTGFDNGEGGIERSSEDNVYEPLSFETEDERQLKVKKSYAESLSELIDTGKNIFLIYPIPEVGWDVPRYTFKRKIHDINAPVSTDATKYYKRSSSVIKLFDDISDADNLYRVQPGKLFCDLYVSQRCITQLDGKLLYFDDDHLSNAGAKLITHSILNMQNKSKPKQ